MIVEVKVSFSSTMDVVAVLADIIFLLMEIVRGKMYHLT